MRPTHPSISTPKAKRRPRFRPPSADGLSMKTLSTQTLIVLTCTFLVATGSQAAEPVIRSKQQAPADLQAVFTSRMTPRAEPLVKGSSWHDAPSCPV